MAYRLLACTSLGAVALVAGCGAQETPALPVAARPAPLVVTVSELEIRANGVDRFTSCPPPGELGQSWIPPIAASSSTSTTELVAEETRLQFRSCYRHGLVRHPMSEGHVALVLRLDANGHPANVESFGACGLPVDAIGCMYKVAKDLRFPPPAGGSDTVTLPLAFASRRGNEAVSVTPTNPAASAAYVTIESARGALHDCEQTARREGRSALALADFTLTVSPGGVVQRVAVDKVRGDEKLLRCAAKSLKALRFAGSGPSGLSTVRTRLHFNPQAAAP